MTIGPMVPEQRAATASARGRWGFGAGPRTLVLLVVGFAWLGPSWWNPRFIVAMLVWDGLVLAAWARDLRAIPPPEALTLRRGWRTPAALDTPARIDITITNGGSRAITATLMDEIPRSLSGTPPVLTAGAPPGSGTTIAYECRPAERGDIEMGRVHLRYRSVLGLAERWASAPLEQKVRVYPSLSEARRITLFLIRCRQIEQERRLSRQRGLGREFESLREFRDGDQLRDVCWTASARQGKLISKVYQVERDQAVWLVVDSGRLLRAIEGGLTKLDHSVNAAIGLAHVALQSGDRVGLLAYGRNPTQCLVPARGVAQLRALMESLADVRTERAEADHLRAARRLMMVQKRRSLVIWLTDLADTATVPEVIEGASQVGRRHVILFVAIGHGGLARAVETEPSTTARMYRYAAALEVMERRSLLLGKLRRQGATTLEARPGDLAVTLVNHYLQIKERGLI